MDLLSSPADELNPPKISDNFGLETDEPIDSISNHLKDNHLNDHLNDLKENHLNDNLKDKANDHLDIDLNDPDEHLNAKPDEHSGLNELSEDQNTTLEEDDESVKVDDLDDEQANRAPNFLNDQQPPSQYDNQHSQYAKMNSIESTTDSSFNQADASYPFCALPANQTNEMNFYLDILRYLLGRLFVDQLPDHVVNFLKIKLLVSVHLVVFVLIIGLIWFISYFVSLIYLAIDNKTKLKNQVCDLQAQLSALKSENQLIKKSQALSKEFEQERSELQKTIDNLLDEKLRVELELGELKSRVKQLDETSSEAQSQKERLKQDLKEELLAKSKLELNLNEKLKKLEEKCDELNSHYNELKTRKQRGDQQIESQAKELAALNETLDQLNEKLKEKEIEIEYLNRMYDELKEVGSVREEKPVSQAVDKSVSTSGSLNSSMDKTFVVSPATELSVIEGSDRSASHSDRSASHSNRSTSHSDKSTNDSGDETESTDNRPTKEELEEQSRVNQMNLHELNRLKHDIEKVQREKDELSAELEEHRTKIDRMAEETSKFEELKAKLVKEKEDAQRYTEFSKKYLREKEDELQVQMQSMKVELEETKRLYLNSEKYASDYWKENQSLKDSLAHLRKDNEQLQRRLVELMNDEKTDPAKVLIPPPIPQEALNALNYLRMAASPTASLSSNQAAASARSPSNQSQISDYYANSSQYLQQQQANLSNYSPHPSLSYQTTSPTHSQRSGSVRLNSSMLSNSSITGHPSANSSMIYPANSSMTNYPNTVANSSVTNYPNSTTNQPSAVANTSPVNSNSLVNSSLMNSAMNSPQSPKGNPSHLPAGRQQAPGYGPTNSTSGFSSTGPNSYGPNSYAPNSYPPNSAYKAQPEPYSPTQNDNPV